MYVFYMKTAHQIASFLLPVHIDSPNWMGVSDGSIIVFESGPYLFLSTINGLMLQRFEGHQSIISNIWVVRRMLLLLPPAPPHAGD